MPSGLVQSGLPRIRFLVWPPGDWGDGAFINVFVLMRAARHRSLLGTALAQRSQLLVAIPQRTVAAERLARLEPWV